MSLEDEWGQTVEATGEYARPDKLEGHLIIVFPLGYVEHMQTRFSVPGKKSDAICCDIIDLDDVDEMGLPGKVYRSSNLMQAQLIMGLRPFIGRKTIVRIGKGQAKNGMNPPWTPVNAVQEPGAVERADAWVAAHPGFTKSPFVARPAAAPQAPLPPSQYPPQPGFQPQPQQGYVQPQPAFVQPQQPYVPQQGYVQPQQSYAQASPQNAPAGGYGQPIPQSNYPGQNQQPVAPMAQYPPAAGVPGSSNLSNQELSVLAQHRAIAAERERQQQAQFGDNPPF